jgi:hypothetical protein
MRQNAELPDENSGDYDTTELEDSLNGDGS